MRYVTTDIGCMENCGKAYFQMRRAVLLEVWHEKVLLERSEFQICGQQAGLHDIV